MNLSDMKGGWTMMDRIVFCPECRQEVKFSVKEKPDSAEIRCKIYEFISKTAYCSACKAEVYVPEIEDENLKVLYDAIGKSQTRN